MPDGTGIVDAIMETTNCKKEDQHLQRNSTAILYRKEGVDDKVAKDAGVTGHPVGHYSRLLHSKIIS